MPIYTPTPPRSVSTLMNHSGEMSHVCTLGNKTHTLTSKRVGLVILSSISTLQYASLTHTRTYPLELESSLRTYTTLELLFAPVS
jgi:hypothetical protein